jgi:hypothetical protein
MAMATEVGSGSASVLRLADGDGDSRLVPDDLGSAYELLLDLSGEGRPGFVLTLPADAAQAATLTAMMTVLGRYRDRLQAVTADGVIHEVPFPRCRYLLRDRLETPPGDWAALADWANARLSRDLPTPEIYLQPDTCTLWAGRMQVVLAPLPFLLYWLLALRCRNGLPWLRGEEALTEELRAFAASTTREVMPGLPEAAVISPGAVKAALDQACAALAAAIALDQGRECCLPVQGLATYGLALTPERVTCPRNYN